MKKYITLLTLLIVFSRLQGQTAENEPNNTFATATLIKTDSVRTGANTNPGDIYDYFMAVLPVDGTLKLVINATNASGSNGYLYLYAYDGRKGSGQILAKYVGNNSNVTPSGSILDTITLYGRAVDTIYFRLETNVAFTYSITYFMTDLSTNDAEPNNTFLQASLVNPLQDKEGHSGYSAKGVSDASDYYKTRLPSDGTLKIYVKATNRSGGTNYLYMYGYDGRKGSGQILAKYVSNNSNIVAGKTIYDTIYLYGRGVDSFWLRFDGSGAFQYSFRYEMIDTSTNDAEPNDVFTQSVPIAELQEKVGHTAYSYNGTTDGFDYYKTLLPKDGTLKIYLKGVNMSGGTNYFYIYAFDGRAGSGQILAKYVSNNSNIQAGKTIYDTIYLYGRGIDTTYFRLQASGAFQYSIKYEMVDTGTNDVEPNSTITEAKYVNHMEEKVGHIRYQAKGGFDTYDYYKTLLPKDGTLKIYVTGVNLSGGTNYLYIYGYDGRGHGGQILGKYINTSNTPAFATIYDTIYLYGRGVDTTFFRLEGSGAFQYSFKYEIIDTSQNDTEPNSTIGQAEQINHLEEKVGHVRYVAKGNADTYDYYRTLLPKDGTLKIYVKGTNMGGGTGYLYIYGFDGRGHSGQILGKYISNNSNIAPWATIYDTIYLFGRAVDTAFFRFEASTAFKYSIKYDIVDTSENDAEPNSITQAVNINANQVKKGHIDYIAKGVRDDYDYFSTALPSDGTVRIYVKGTNRSGSTEYLYIYAYDGRKHSGQILAKYIGNKSNVLHEETVADSIDLACRGKDSLYYRLESSGAFQYEISYKMINLSGNDIESNNTFNTAPTIPLNTHFNGHIGYYTAGSPDDNDYYKVIMPPRGSIKVITEVTNTSGSNGYTYIYGYDKRKGSGQVMAKYVKNLSTQLPGVTYRDTIFLNCFNSDTFYLRWTSSNCFKYSFRIEFVDRQPKANTENERFANTVGFRPQFSNGDKFIWDFGDGTTSTVKYPIKEFKIGYWVAKLIVTNSFCNYKDTATENIEVKGVEYYTPDKGGAGGDVSMHVFGGGLDTTTGIKLVNGTTTILPVEKHTNSVHNKLTVIWDLHFASGGSYDVVIEIPGQPPVTYPDGFVINDLIYPYTWSEVQGPSRFRTNVNTRFNLVVGNKGNVTASGVILAMVWPKDVTITWENKFITPPDTGIMSVTLDGDPHVYSLPRKDYHFIYDSLETSTPIDSFAGKPYKGYIRYLIIPHIPANSTVEFPFIAKTTSVATNRFITYTHKPNMWGSCHTGNWMDYNEDITAELIDGADMIVDKTNVPLLKAFTKTAKIGQKHAGSAASYLGKHFWAWYDGYEVDGAAAMGDWMKETEANNAFALQTATDELGGFMLNKGIGKLNSTYQTQVDFINKRLANNPNMSPKLAEAYLDKLNKLSGANKRLNGLKEMLDNTKNLGTLSDKLVKLQAMVADCPELQKQLDDLIKQLDKELNQQDVKETNTNSVTSMDPNEINGPAGTGSQRFVNRNDRQRFVVSFENVDTATAAAQIVTVYDTLDKTKFDLSTFEFGDLSIGARKFRVPKGRQQFVMEEILSTDMHVRINGQLDTATGVVTWQFTAIDPVTKDIPVFEGFLPPNVTKPEGEGSGSYTVYPLKTVPDGTLVTNRATIIFDNNVAIATNTWTNIIDVLPPSSTVTAKLIPGKTVIRLSFNGNDASSGIGYYNLFVRINGGSWIAFGGTSDDTMLIEAGYGNTYSFCAISNDRVGNMEIKSLTPESTVGMNDIYNAGSSLALFPNPVKDMVSIERLKDFKSFQVTDISGRVMLSGHVNPDSETIDVSTLKTGMYIITVTGSSTVSLKLLKL